MRFRRFWLGQVDPVTRQAAEQAFRKQAGAPGATLERIWTAMVAAMAAYMLAVIWVVPVLLPGWLRLAANALHAFVPGRFAGSDAALDVLANQHLAATGILVLLAAPVAAGCYAMAHRESLAEGYDAADARVSGLYLGQPGRGFTAVGLLLAGWVLGLGVLWWLAGLAGSQAASELLIRVAVTRDGRLRLAGRLFVRCLRTRSFAATLVLAGLLTARAIWFPPGPAAPSPAAQSHQVRADPRVAAADEQVEQAYQAALHHSVAASDLVRLHQLWRTGHLFDTDVAAAQAADAAFQRRIGMVEKFWEDVQSRRFSLAELHDTCDQVGQATGCRTTRVGLVDGSDGRLGFRLTAPDYAGLFPPGPGDPSQLAATDTAADVFRPDGDGWRLVLHASFDGAAVQAPRQIASVAGPLLVIPADAGGMGDATAVYAAGDDGWRWLDTGVWLKQAASALPAHACLLHTLYLRSSQPLFTSVQPDYRTMTASALFGADPDAADRLATGRIDLRLGIDGGALVVAHSAVVTFPKTRGWLARLFAARPQC